MIFQIGDNVLYDKDITVDISPQISIQFGGCALSLQLVDVNNAEGHFCIQLQATCGIIPVRTYSFGCITDDRLKNCVGCPNNCNDNGACSNGVCACYTGWTGYDCSQVVPLYEKCKDLPYINLQMCTQVRYSNCKMKYSFLVANSTIASFHEHAADLVHNPDYGSCFSYLGCNLCLKTQNFQGSATSVSACLKMEVKKHIKNCKKKNLQKSHFKVIFDQMNFIFFLLINLPKKINK